MIRLCLGDTESVPRTVTIKMTMIQEVLLSMLKRFFALVLCIAMVLSLVPAVQAEEGLPHPVATYFSDAKYNDYTIVDCVEIRGYCFVLLKNDKENILYGFRKSNDSYKYWMRSKNAVMQGANALSMAEYTGSIVDGCNLTLSSPTFGIMYDTTDGDDIVDMVFYSLVDGNWLLKAYINTKADISMYFKHDTLTYYSYYDHKKLGEVTGTFQRDIRHTSVARIPLTLKDAQNRITTAPELPANSELIAEEIKFVGSQKYAVYSGPGMDFLRGGSQKATVSTNDWIQVFGEEDGWILVQYAINKDTYRFGYIEAASLPKDTTVKALDFSAAEAIAQADAAITDDPLFSGTELASLSAGTQVTWLASMGSWAYIATEIDDMPVRGFVPADALELVEVNINAVED